MNIDLCAVEKAVEELKAAHGLAGTASCIDLVLWKYRNGERVFSIRVSISTPEGVFQSAEGATWQSVLDRLRLALDTQTLKLQAFEPVTVDVP